MALETTEINRQGIKLKPPDIPPKDRSREVNVAESKAEELLSMSKEIFPNGAVVTFFDLSYTGEEGLEINLKNSIHVATGKKTGSRFLKRAVRYSGSDHEEDWELDEWSNYSRIDQDAG